MLSTITLLILAAVVRASPISDSESFALRAGGPAYVPITPPCTLSYPVSGPGSTPSQAYHPAVDITSTQIYSWDIDMPDSVYQNESAWWTECIEQCNGLSGCRAAFLAYEVPAESRYGAPGGYPSVGCRMFNVFLREGDFAAVTNGSYTQAIAGNIDGCGK
ncbi:hypothetical protein B0H10DRAFT_2035159 [Mycena sp. CBHHK59/15]|nr:hypothetical protein B0H10DRAFT_2035159 [Mycena sp. CBHHK59/15]